MKKEFFILFAFAILIAAVAGCEEMTQQETHKIQKFGIDEQSSQISETEVLKGSIQASTPISVTFVNLLGKKEHKSKSIDLVLANGAEFNAEVKLRLQCLGLSTFVKYLELGQFQLAPGESQNISVDATDLPIQSEINVGQIRAEIDYRSLDREDEFSRSLSPMLYYVFDKQFEKIRLFENEILGTDFKGVLIQKVKWDKNANKPERVKMGKVRNKSGEFEDIYADNKISSEFSGSDSNYIEEIRINYGPDAKIQNSAFVQSETEGE